MKKYTFEILDPTDDYADELCDYTLFVTDAQGSDNLGSHTPSIDAVLSPLGIHSESMENTFGGDWNLACRNKDDLKKYLIRHGWTMDHGIIIT